MYDWQAGTTTPATGTTPSLLILGNVRQMISIIVAILDVTHPALTSTAGLATVLRNSNLAVRTRTPQHTRAFFDVKANIQPTRPRQDVFKAQGFSH